MTNLPIGKTTTNLESAIAGETREYMEGYPAMAKIAREEGFTAIADWFERLASAEKNHGSPLSAGAQIHQLTHLSVGFRLLDFGQAAKNRGNGTQPAAV